MRAISSRTVPFYAAWHRSTARQQFRITKPRARLATLIKAGPRQGQVMNDGSPTALPRFTLHPLGQFGDPPPGLSEQGKADVRTMLLRQRTPLPGAERSVKATPAALRETVRSTRRALPRRELVALLPQRRSVPIDRGVTLRAPAKAGSCNSGTSRTISCVGADHLCPKRF